MTATFTYAPSFSSVKNSAPRILTATFGDGYQQDLVDGINADLKSWDLSFINRTSTDADAIEAFFSSTLGQAFNWTPPVFQASTTATAEPFGTGDGTTAAFTLKKNGVAVRNITASPLIYRNDWQGNQLLFATARTNNCLWSEQIDNAGWTKLNLVITANATAAPDGTGTMDKMVDTATNGVHFIRQSIGGTSDGAVTVLSFFVKAAEFSQINMNITKRDGTIDSAVLNIGVSSSGWAAVPMGGGIYRYSKPTNMGTGATTPLFQINTYNGTTNSYAGTGQGFYVWGMQTEQASSASPYIGPTTTAAVTVTDYSVNLTTGLVTLANAPQMAAALTWTGSFTLTYLFKCMAWKRTPVDYGVDTVTATFKQVLG